jgi:DNA-binding transcriptional LysR family regulator
MSRAMDSLGGMAIFVQVAEARSFAVAGRRLSVSASAVSKGVARLEEKLRVRLFHRSTRSVTLTAEGAQFLDRCRRILAEIEAAEHELSSTIEAPRGRLRISLPLVSGLMMPVLSAFMHRYPEIALDLNFTDHLVDVIGEGFDAVVRIGQPEDSRLLSRRLGSCRLMYVGSPGYFEKTGGIPLRPEDLRGHKRLLHRFSNSGLLEKWPLEEPGASSSPAIASNHVETLLDMALRGHGIARLPDFAIAASLAKGELQSVLEEWRGDASIFWALWPAGKHQAPKLRAFVDFLAVRLFPTDVADPFAPQSGEKVASR